VLTRGIESLLFMKISVLIVAAAVLFLAAGHNALAEVLGTFGATYGIAEKDAVSELEEQARKVDWRSKIDKKAMERRVKNYMPGNLPVLPVATEDRKFLTDMTYTSDMEVPDVKGGILYPKGYTFNPLEYVALPNIIVVIDGSDRKQVEWFENSPYMKDVRTMVILTGGSYYELTERFKRPVYYAIRNVVGRMGLDHVPSVAVQKGKYMEISEYVPVVPEKLKKKKDSKAE